MELQWTKKIINDMNKQRILNCYELKKKMSQCIEKNEGNIEGCIKFRRDFEDCLNIIDKCVAKHTKNITS